MVYMSRAWARMQGKFLVGKSSEQIVVQRCSGNRRSCFAWFVGRGGFRLFGLVSVFLDCQLYKAKPTLPVQYLAWIWYCETVSPGGARPISLCPRSTQKHSCIQAASSRASQTAPMKCKSLIVRSQKVRVSSSRQQQPC